jgi:hypothetical protein
MTEIIEEAQTNRAVQIMARLKEIKKLTDESYLDTCELLFEAHQNNYHQTLGYTTFIDWVTTANLDISARTAFYYIGIQKKSNILGLTRAQLSLCNVSSLKEIFTLDPVVHGPEMLNLVEVALLKCVAGEEPPVYLTLKLSASIKDTLENAFEVCRRLYGSVESESGPVDISDSKCVELIFLSYLQDPNNQAQG